MNETNEERQPPTPPTRQGEIPPDRKPESALDGYHTAAETVGMIPSLRWKDNLFQALFIIGATGAGALVGLAVRPMGGATAGVNAAVLGVAGLIGSFFLSGLVLMVLGWVRAAKRHKG